MRNQSCPTVSVILMVFGLLLSAGMNYADDCCCAHCGGQSATKVCRLVQEEKKVTVTCWGYQDEDFCVPGPSAPGCRHEECACQECDPAGKTCFTPKKYSWLEWQPKACPQVFTKRKLMKRTVTKKVPSYKWVVEDLCEPCQQTSQSSQVSPTAQIPPVPPLAPGVQIVRAKTSETD